MRPVPAGKAALWLVRLATLLLVIAAVAWLFEVLASQAPSSAYHVGVLPGPFGELCATSTVLALCLALAAWLVPLWSPDREPWIWTAVATTGTIVLVSALTYGASKGVYGVQVEDPRPGSGTLFVVKGAGATLLFLCLLDLCRRVWLPSSASKARAAPDVR